MSTDETAVGFNMAHLGMENERCRAAHTARQRSGGGGKQGNGRSK